jgi:hypothetical protein
MHLPWDTDETLITPVLSETDIRLPPMYEFRTVTVGS